jgi:hypothetical protein
MGRISGLDGSRTRKILLQFAIGLERTASANRHAPHGEVNFNYDPHIDFPPDNLLALREGFWRADLTAMCARNSFPTKVLGSLS